MNRFSFFNPKQSIDSYLRDLKTKSSAYWMSRGEDMAIRLFRFASANIPAYKKFLKQKRIAAGTIRSIADFKKLPLLEKASYVHAHSLPDLLPNGDVSQITTFAATSGSTGEPTFFPRGEEQDWEYERVAEAFLKNQFEIDKKSTLGVIGFGLGIWIGGIFTYKTFNQIAQKGNRLSLLPIGPNKEMYLKSIKKFGHLYDQVLLMGYAPFIKDIIDEAPMYGIDWKKYNIRILTAAEGYSEEFLEYLAKKTHVKNPLLDIVNIYGTVEIGTMAHTTALTNLIRKILSKNPRSISEIFPRPFHLPTLAQYDPTLFHFENYNGEVICSGFGSLFPLIRYRFPDTGGMMSFDEMNHTLKKAGIDIIKEVKKAGIEKNIWRLPFVYIYERSDFTLTFRGANIYPEEIKVALAHSFLQKYITGKFTMRKKADKRLNDRLEINIELKRGARDGAALRAKIQKIVTDYLRKANSEFNDQYASAPDRVIPQIVLWQYQNPVYFMQAGKQKWAKK